MASILRQSLLIAGKDTKSFFKDRFAVGFSFLFPFLFVIGFSLALSGQGPTDSQLVITAASQEESGLSHEILNGLSQSEEGAIRVIEYSAALAELESGDIEGFVAFPADFSQDLLSGRPVTLEVIVGSGSVETEAALTGFAESVAGNVSVVGNALGAIQEIAAGNQALIQNTDMTSLMRGPASRNRVRDRENRRRQTLQSLQLHPARLPDNVRLFRRRLERRGNRARAADPHTGTVDL